MKIKIIDDALQLFEPKLDYRETLQEYLDMVIPEVKRWSEDLGEQDYWVNKPWLEINDQDLYKKVVHIFRPEGIYLRSEHGVVKKGDWEWLDPYEKIMVKLMVKPEEEDEEVEQHFLYNRRFLDDTFFILQLDDEKTYLALGHELKIGRLEWRDYIEKLYFGYKSRRDNVVLIASIIAVIVASILFFSVF